MTTRRTYTENQVRDLIRERADSLGSMAALARELQVSTGYLCDVMAGRMGIGDRLAEALNLERQPPLFRVKEPA